MSAGWRTLSSRQTFFVKVVSPVVWIIGVGFVTLGLSMRFKRVRMGERSLYISNYISELEVPLTDLVAVEENTWLKTHPVTIEFRRHTAFGSRIVFMPKVRWRFWWASHPVVAEIASAVDRARGSASGETPA